MSAASDHYNAVEMLRPYLRTLARMQLEAHLQARIDASDIVQQTMLDAHLGRERFRGHSPEELRGWLRRMLARNLADEIRKLRRMKRDAGLEQSLNRALQESSLGMERFLTAADTRPEEQAIRDEQLVALAAAVEMLPPDQRQAVTLHHLSGFTAAEVAEQMDRTEISVAGLLRRGLKRLRELMKPDDHR